MHQPEFFGMGGMFEIYYYNY